MEFLCRLFAGDPPGVDKSVVVVSGLPRSGTSMLMSMISAGGLEEVVDGVRQADDDNPRGYHELEAVKDLDKNGDTAWLDDAHGKVVKIISFLLQHLPATHHYKIVFVRRSLQEVLASQQKMLDRRGASGGDAADAEMARVFAAHLSKIERQLAARKNCEVLYVEHRAAVTQPAAVAERVNAFLGGSLDVEKMSGVVDSQLYRNRAGQNAGSGAT
jgi:hypothetical protein